MGQFTSRSSGAVEERKHELEGFSEQLSRNLEASATAMMERFRSAMASERDANLAEGRGALAAEFASALDGYRLERDAHDKAWAENVERMGQEAADKYRDRLDAACDSWIVSSVRRLNEHGQNVIELLMRSADQALRESCARLFDGLSEMIRDRGASSATAAGVPGFAPPPRSEGPDAPAPHNEATRGASA